KLSPTEFGIMGMAMAVIAIANVFVGLGFTRAIIQKQNIDKIQYNTVFLINTGIALVLTLLCFFVATPLSHFYKEPLVQPVFQVLSITFLFNGLNIIPSALIYKRMNFRMATIFNLVASIISGIIGVVMAYKGFGVWALVAQAVLNAFITLVLTWFYIGWWPGFKVNFPSIKSLWTYGSRMFASGLLDVFFTKIDAFIIGKIFSPATLGYYTRAQSLDSIVKQLSSNSITTVLFPYISAHQNDKPTLANIYKKYLHFISFASIGLTAIFFLTAKDLFIVLFTAKWIYAAELFQLMALSGFAWPVSALMVSLIAGMGNSKDYLKLEILKKGVLLPVYIFGFLIGLKGFILGIVLAYLISVWLNAKYVEAAIDMRTNEQLVIILKYIVPGVVSAAAVFFIMRGLSTLSPFIKIPVEGLLFSSAYVLLAFAFKLDAFFSIKKLITRSLRFVYDKRN
ncbi:MAG: lipopolysaccharide biosynthesis protein, partial [Chitinophagaceae bacterium]